MMSVVLQELDDIPHAAHYMQHFDLRKTFRHVQMLLTLRLGDASVVDLLLFT